jgi:hypothetical protein
MPRVLTVFAEIIGGTGLLMTLIELYDTYVHSDPSLCQGCKALKQQKRREEFEWKMFWLAVVFCLILVAIFYCEHFDPLPVEDRNDWENMFSCYQNDEGYLSCTVK